MMAKNISIRNATKDDYDFIFSLSEMLATQAKLGWHSEETLIRFQDRYIEETLEETEGNIATFIAEVDGQPAGFIHMHEGTDELSLESITHVPLLAVSPSIQGKGLGQLLMKEAEAWAKSKGHRLVHLEVFANNVEARAFYQKQGFREETLILVKPL